MHPSFSQIFGKKCGFSPRWAIRRGAAFAVGAPQGCADPPPGGLKNAPLARQVARKPPWGAPSGRPVGAPQKGSKKGQFFSHAAVRFFGIVCDFPGRGAPPRGAPCAASCAEPPRGPKNAPLCRTAAQCRATLLQWLNMTFTGLLVGDGTLRKKKKSRIRWRRELLPLLF